MRLPRRVPWVSVSELEQLCSWIFNDEDDLELSRLAIKRITAWRAITALPHALESTLSLLTVIVLDKESATTPRHAISSTCHSLNIRQSYAAAIIRLVNGLVDPLQLGAYARSIASIAAQIGLPAWLVDLRHAATHEDLPSIELLKQGAAESMAWLLHHYFIPNLSQNTQLPNIDEVTEGLSPLQPLLKRYKLLVKSIAKDKSLYLRLNPDVTKILRDIERWIGEARLAATSAIFDGWGSSTNGLHEDNPQDSMEQLREKYALDVLCDNLLSRGCLIPVSSKKRLKAPSKIGLPDTLTSLWLPLLSGLIQKHPYLPGVLISRIVSSLLRSPADENQGEIKQRNTSFELCMASWVAFILDKWGSDESRPSMSMNETSDTLRREDVVITIMSSLPPRVEGTAIDTNAMDALLSALCAHSLYLQEMLTRVLPLTQLRPVNASFSDDDTQVMEERLNSFIEALGSPLPKNEKYDMISHATISDDKLPSGWTITGPPSTWNSHPIGVYLNTL